MSGEDARILGDVMVFGDLSSSFLTRDGKDAGDGKQAAHDASYTLSNYVIDQNALSKPQPAAESPSAMKVASTFVYSLGYAAIQSPIDGAVQLANGAGRPFNGGKDFMPQIEIMKQPDAVPFGGAEWTAKLAGGGIGTILPFWLGGKAAVRCAEAVNVGALRPAIQRLGILEENSVGQLAFKGAVYEGVFHPVDEKQGSLWGQRAVNFGSGALSFLALGATNKWMRESSLGSLGLNSTLRAVPLTSELAIDGISGAVSGVTDTVIHAAASGTPPTWENVAQSAGEYGLMSIFLRIGRLPVEKAAGEKTPTHETADAGSREPVPAGAGAQFDYPVQFDPNSLRKTLPFDHVISFKRAVAAEIPADAEHVGSHEHSGRKLFFRDVADAPEGQRYHISHEELSGDQFQHVEHRGQAYAIHRSGQAFAYSEISPGVYELIPTDKIILDRLNEIQVPWPPMQSQEDYKAHHVLRLADLWARPQPAN